MTSWATAVEDLTAYLAEWDTYLADPGSQTMPLEPVPSLPRTPVDEPHIAEVQRLARRVIANQDAVSALSSSLRSALEHTRKLQSAVTAYQA